jgi:hypothetical protein
MVVKSIILIEDSKILEEDTATGITNLLVVIISKHVTKTVKIVLTVPSSLMDQVSVAESPNVELTQDLMLAPKTTNVQWQLVILIQKIDNIRSSSLFKVAVIVIGTTPLTVKSALLLAEKFVKIVINVSSSPMVIDLVAESRAAVLTQDQTNVLKTINAH